MPRRYDLGKRTAQVELTRRRLVGAAIELYTERGISHVTMLQVAHRADVAPNTAFNHFATREALDEEIAGVAVREMAVPDAAVIDGGLTLAARIAQLALVVGAFFERAGRWYRMWLREPMLGGPWLAAGEQVSAGWDAVFRAALGSLSDDADAMDVVRAAMQPPFFEQVAARGRAPDETAALVAAALVPWLELRERAARRRPPSR